MKKRSQTDKAQASQFDLMKLIESQAGLNGLIHTRIDHTVNMDFKSAPSREFIRLKYGY